MARLFADPFHDRFASWALGYIPYGGASFGEVAAIADAVGQGDDEVFHAAWVAAAERVEAEGEAALAKSHRASARELLLKASCFYGVSFHPLYGSPVDPRLLSAYRRQIGAFDRALALGTPPVAPMSIPFDGASMAAYLVPAEGAERAVRPLVILTNGYDATVTDLYFSSAVAASRRGYHCLLFDGPGQGGMLYEQGVPLRPDWETVVAAVVDMALTLPIVDPARIVLSGWSLGGHLAPRAASGEHRLAALIADPGGWDICGMFRSFAIRLGIPPEAVTDLAAIPRPILDRLERTIRGDRELRWTIMQRNCWVHGVDNLQDYLRAALPFTMEGRAELIRCPTLFTVAENDPLAAGTADFFAELRCPKDLIRFGAAEGAGGHCEMANRPLLNARVLDWLDDRFDR